MQNINQFNYEIFFIDYIDGNLTKEQEKELSVFLDNNPELKVELDSFTEISLNNENISFQGKKKLLKSNLANDNSDSNFSDLCIARIEGDLDEDKIDEFESLINESGKNKNEYQLFLKTINKIDKDIVFPDKESLLKSINQKSKIRHLYTYLSLAASVIIVISLWFMLPKELNTNNNFAETKINNDIEIVDKEITQKETKNNEDSKSKSKKTSNKGNSIKNSKSNKKTKESKERLKQPSHNIIIKINEPIKLAKAKEIKIDEPASHYTTELKTVNTKATLNDNMLAANISNSKNSSLPKDIVKTAATTINKNINVKKIQSTSIWDIAEACINGVNYITGSNIKFEQKLDDTGKTKKIKLETKYFALNTPIKNNESGLKRLKTRNLKISFYPKP